MFLKMLGYAFKGFYICFYFSYLAKQQAMARDRRARDDRCAADHRVRQDGSGFHEPAAGRPDHAAQRR